MSEQTTVENGDGQVKPVETPAPKNDAEAAAQAQQASETKTEEPPKKTEDDGEARKRNRTREYIQNLQRQNAEMRAKLAQMEATQRAEPKADKTADAEPTLDDFDYDFAAWQKAHVKWAIDQETKSRTEQEHQSRKISERTKLIAAYETKVADFAEAHPDFYESIAGLQQQYPFDEQTQLAIIGHERGPEIAYHLANNDEDAFLLANVRPELAAHAVERIASRLAAAQQQKAPQTQVTTTPAKPVTKAPPPAPTVTGATPTETPPEKLTDDEWYARETAKRKRDR